VSARRVPTDLVVRQATLADAYNRLDTDQGGDR
jgi:hypothetical protein